MFRAGGSIDSLVMKTLIKKINSRAWEWSIDRGTEHLAGGYSKTKADAENDSRIAATGIERDEARASGRIVAGDEVRIKPEWQDAGDDKFTFVAFDTQLPGMLSIRVRAICNATGELGIGVQSVYLNMLDR